MADEDRSFHTSTPEANRAVEHGQGVGARELAAQRDPGELDDAAAAGETIAETEADDGQDELPLGRAHPA